MKWFATEHVMERMAQRGINKDMIDTALKTGTLIKSEQDKKAYLVCTNFVYLVISFSSNQRKSCRVHTVYKPSDYQLKKYGITA